MSIFILLSGKTHLFSGNLGLCCICGWSFFHQVRNSLALWHIVDRVMAFVKALFDLFIKAKGHIILLLEWPFVAFNKVIYDLQLLSTKPKIKVFVIIRLYFRDLVRKFKPFFYYFIQSKSGIFLKNFACYLKKSSKNCGCRKLWRWSTHCCTHITVDTLYSEDFVSRVKIHYIVIRDPAPHELTC